MSIRKNILKAFERTDSQRAIMNNLAEKRVVKIKYNLKEAQLVHVKQEVTRDEIYGVRIVSIERK